MNPRDTRTGAVLEQMIFPALDRGGYHFRRGVNINHRPGGGRHKLDVFCWDDNGNTFLVSLKWQQGSGTAEQKVPFEVICLSEAVLARPAGYPNVRCHTCDASYHDALSPGGSLRAYLVLGGEGWSLRDFYVSGGLSKYIPNAHLVNILTLEGFATRTNNSKL